MDRNFKMIERRYPGGKVTVVEHRKTGFRSLVFSGRCYTSRTTALSSKIGTALRSVGRQILHSFPSILLQNDFILTFDPNASYRPVKTVALEYEYHFVIAVDISTETAIESVLNSTDSLQKIIEERIKQIEAEYG